MIQKRYKDLQQLITCFETADPGRPFEHTFNYRHAFITDSSLYISHFHYEDEHMDLMAIVTVFCVTYRHGFMAVERTA